MAATLSEFLANPDAVRTTKNPCPICHEEIDPNDPAGPQFVDKVEVCADCYFVGLGDIVEVQPVGRATAHGHAPW